MIEKLLLKMRQRYAWAEDQERRLRSAMTESRNFGSDEIITPEGQRTTFSSLLVGGFACRSKYLPDGERQIMEISVPGDFVDLHSYPLGRLDHSVTALSPCTIVKLPHKEITAMIGADPGLGRILWFLTMIDASIHREWLVSLGKRSAIESLAHLFCEILYRLSVVEMADGLSYPFPLTQSELGEVRGVTVVHISRTLGKLREQGLVTFRNQTVTIHDQQELEALAGFDPAYLYLEPREL